MVPLASRALYGSLETAWVGATVVVDVVAAEVQPVEDRERDAVRRVIDANADRLAAGDTSGVPDAMKERIRAELSPRQLEVARRWYHTNRPDASTIRQLARDF